MDDEHEGQVVKVVDYDAFGNVLSDTNPALFLPLGFAGGLRDRFTGLTRFCLRVDDPTVGRFTAPDPMGGAGSELSRWWESTRGDVAGPGRGYAGFRSSLNS